MSVQELYQQAIKELAAAGAGQGRLEAPDARALLDNPLCGDRVEIEVKLSAGRIAALAHSVKGCLLCRAAAAAIGQRATGASAAEVERVTAQLTEMPSARLPPDGWPVLRHSPVHGHRSRYGCVLLPFNTLLAALRARPDLRRVPVKTSIELPDALFRRAKAEAASRGRKHQAPDRGRLAARPPGAAGRASSTEPRPTDEAGPRVADSGVRESQRLNGAVDQIRPAQIRPAIRSAVRGADREVEIDLSRQVADEPCLAHSVKMRSDRHP